MSPEQLLHAFRLRIKSLLRRREVESELDEELQFHLAHLIESNIAKGMRPEDARYQALKSMEGCEQKKEECRDLRGVNWIENTVRDIRYGVRMLRRSPVFTAVAILSLALGIGANSAIFSLVDTLLLRPLPVPHPKELRNLFLSLPERPQPFLSYPMFQSLQAHNQAFTVLTAWANRRFQFTSGDEVTHVDGEVASGTYFSMLNVAPALGRAFTEADDHPFGGNDGPVAVISDRFWKRQFQSSPAAIGSSIVLDQIRFTVVGVMPPDFFGAEIGTHPEVWIPISFAGRGDNSGCITSRNCWWLTVMGRMKPEVTADQANANLATISSPVLQETTPPGFNEAMQKRYRLYSFSSNSGEQGWSFLRLRFSDPILILAILSASVLLIACANMANLLLARSSARHREIAVRLSMGAGRPRIIRQLITESVLLSLAGGLTGVLFAFWLNRILMAFVSATQRHGPGQFTRLDLQLDWRVLLFTFTLASISGILFGLAPAVRSTGVGIAAALKQSVNNLRGSRNTFQLDRLLLTLQTALSVVLVCAAGLFAGTLYRLLTVNYGFNLADVSLIRVDMDKRTEKGPALIDLYSRILERVNGLPDVKAASLLSHVPLTFPGWAEKVGVPAKGQSPARESSASMNWIGPRFFDALEIRLVAGRQFDEHDTAVSEKVGIISEFAAQRLFPNENPMDQHVLLAGKPIRIVGVVEGIKYMNLRDKEPPELYIPSTQKSGETASFTFILKTNPGARSPNAAFRALLHELAPDVPIGMAYTMEQQVESSIGLERLMASLSVFFGVLALLLTAIGIYGILAYSVARRTGEIGIRMALGARPVNVIWLVVRGASGSVAAGIIVGTLVTLAESRVVATFLYGTQPNDPGNFAAAVTALLVVAVFGALLPSLRASRIDPSVSLRQD